MILWGFTGLEITFRVVSDRFYCRFKVLQKDYTGFTGSLKRLISEGYQRGFREFWMRFKMYQSVSRRIYAFHDASEGFQKASQVFS